jgi:hypothetical protein
MQMEASPLCVQVVQSRSTLLLLLLSLGIPQHHALENCERDIRKLIEHCAQETSDNQRAHRGHRQRDAAAANFTICNDREIRSTICRFRAHERPARSTSALVYSIGNDFKKITYKLAVLPRHFSNHPLSFFTMPLSYGRRTISAFTQCHVIVITAH